MKNKNNFYNAKHPKYRQDKSEELILPQSYLQLEAQLVI